MEDELHHPLRPLRERLRRVEVVEAGEVDEREGEQERERDDRGAREARVAALEPVPGEEDEEDGREDVGERQRAGELPLELVERDREHRRQEEPVEHGLREHALAHRARERTACEVIAGEGSGSLADRLVLERRLELGGPGPARRAPAPLASDSERRRRTTFQRPQPSRATSVPAEARLASTRVAKLVSRSTARIVEPAVDDVDGLTRRPAGATHSSRAGKPGRSAGKRDERIAEQGHAGRPRTATHSAAHSRRVGLVAGRRPPTRRRARSSGVSGAARAARGTHVSARRVPAELLRDRRARECAQVTQASPRVTRATRATKKTTKR